jgi:hypothetical protein
MNHQSVGVVFAIAISPIASLPTQAMPRTPSPERQVREVVTHLVGIMHTSAQAAENPEAPNVRMTTCRVRVDSTEARSHPSVFLYQEQALSHRLDSPYRQRFLQITPSSEGVGVESIAFKPPVPETWIGLCDRPQAQRIIQPNEIGEYVCRVFLQPAGENYVGETPSEGCPTNYRGAATITNTILLHEAGMDTQDRGFDASGNLVWGATEEPYQFRWLEP